MKQRHEAFEGDLATHQERVEQIAAIAHELKSVTHVSIARCYLRRAHFYTSLSDCDSNSSLHL